MSYGNRPFVRVPSPKLYQLGKELQAKIYRETGRKPLLWDCMVKIDKEGWWRLR